MLLKHIIGLCCLILLCTGCVNYTQTKNDLVQNFADKLKKTRPGSDGVTTVYIQAVSEYLKAAFQKNKFSPDTFFGGIMPEEPVIDWPQSIDNIPIRGITIEESAEKMKQKKSWSNANIVGWPDKGRVKFIVVAFLDGGKPQYNCHLYFKNTGEKNKLKLDSVNFEYCYAKK